MIRKLRFKLVGISMLSLLLVLTLIIGLLNATNYRGIARGADNVLALLRDSDGPSSGEHSRLDWRRANPRFRSPELPFEMRYFTVQVDEDGEPGQANVERIAAVDEAMAIKYARRALASGRERGFADSYRFLLCDTQGDGRELIFLDCGRLLESQRQVLLISVVISWIGYMLVFALAVLLSKRIVKPFSENYEKQRRFITDAGHELKTPLTIIDADAEILSMDLGEDNEWLADIRQQSKRLAGLTNDLITLSRLEEDSQTQMIEFALSDVVSEAAGSFQTLARTQGKHFEARIEPMLSYTGSEKGISQLVSILLDNAIKYTTADGRIALTLEKRPKGIALSVENTVENLPQETLDNMFERFYRGDSSRSSKTPGYGLGLSIASAIVATHKGKISAAMRDPQTLAITVTLPTR